MKNQVSIFLILLTLSSYAQDDPYSPSQMLPGNWVGIDMYQDDDSYDGKNYFLPNEEFLIISPNSIKIYFYPYSKSDEFDVKITDKKILYTIGRKYLETEYYFTNKNCDTMIFKMHFINKSFVKMYSRVTSTNERMEVDFATLDELDQYGFNPSAVTHLFELDTFHTEFYSGFEKLDSLGFKPYQFLQFKNDMEFAINQGELVRFSRNYKTIKFLLNGVQQEFKIEHCEGTQNISIIPVSLCNCSDIVIPYLTVNWANRIRKDMRENSFKYKN